MLQEQRGPGQSLELVGALEGLLLGDEVGELLTDVPGGEELEGIVELEGGREDCGDGHEARHPGRGGEPQAEVLQGEEQGEEVRGDGALEAVLLLDVLLEQDQRGDDAHGGGDHVQSHVEGVGVVGAEPHGEILEGRHLERRTITSSNARASGRAVETRHETRSSDTLTRRVSSRECATQTTGGRRPAKWRLRGAVTSLPAGSNRRIPPCWRRGNVWCCQLATPRTGKIPFREKCMYSQSLLFVGTILRAWENRNGREKLASGRRRRPRRARRVGRQRMLFGPSSRGESRFSLVDGTLAAAPRAGAAYKVRVSRRAARCSRTTRTSW